ncbi:MAG: hypothetical protein ABIJ65_09305 [Chloroflexota bacterium]
MRIIHQILFLADGQWNPGIGHIPKQGYPGNLPEDIAPVECG